MTRVTTIDKCLNIFEMLLRVEGHGLGVRALARRLGMNVTSTHNMCRTLCLRGYLWQDPISKRFQLGPGLALFAQSGAVWQRLAAVAEPITLLCQAALGESILLATMNSTEIVTLTYHPSSQALRVDEPHTMGDRAYCTAVGKVLLGAMNDEQLAVYLHRFPPRPFTPETLTDPEHIRAELAAVRAQGYSRTSNELTLGVNAVAVPIQRPDGQLFAALGASAPALRMDWAGMRSTRHTLVCYAARIQRRWFLTSDS